MNSQQATYEANDHKKKIFDNPIVERLSRTPIYAPIILYFIISAGLLYWAVANASLPVPSVVLLFFAGWLTFTLIEYLVHRYVFHMAPKTKTRKRIQYNFHGVHHEYPKDKDRLAMPIPVSIMLALFLFGFFYLLIKTYTYGFLPGMLVGYASYLFVHYIVHAYAPPKNIFKHLWINHAIHHYKDDKVIFGVSSPLWDYLLGTMPKNNKSS